MNAIFMKKLVIIRNQSAQYAPLNAKKKDLLFDVCSMYSDSEIDGGSQQPL